MDSPILFQLHYLSSYNIETMYEPHLVDYASTHRRSLDAAENERNGGGSGVSLLEELDKIAPIKAFDAFPKVDSTYVSSTRRGGVLTAVVGAIIFLLVLNDLGEYLYGAPDYLFKVDHDVARDLQLNVDLTVAMPCQCESSLCSAAIRV